MKGKSTRVLFPFVGDSVGGSYISAFELIRELRKLSVEPIILLHNGKGVLAEWLTKRRVEWFEMPLPHVELDRMVVRNIFRIARGYKKSKRIIKELKIDIVHGNDGRINRTWAIWASAANVPMVWHQRIIWSGSAQVRATLPFVSGIISISQYVAAVAPRVGAYHETIYNPVSCRNFINSQCSEKLKQELSLSPETRIIGCFGNSQKLKRPDTIVKAASIMNRRSVFPVKFVWFGNDKDGELGKLLSTEDDELPVIHLPFRDNVQEAIAGCDVIISASERDAFGRTLVEAMNIGIPVVASDAGGHREIVAHGRNGLLFPVGDAVECAKMLWTILEDKDLCAALVEEGKVTARGFSGKRHAQAVTEFYRKVLCSEKNGVQRKAQER